jgi:hypothetical protein
MPSAFTAARYRPTLTLTDVFPSPLTVLRGLRELLKQGLLWWGSDDNVVAWTDNDGKNWTRITSFPGVPSFAKIADLEMLVATDGRERTDACDRGKDGEDEDDAAAFVMG